MKHIEASNLKKIPAGKECPSSAICGAPLCPLDRNMAWRLWYPDEESCHARKFQGLSWVKNQRKIRKRTREPSRYFTLKMLRRNCIIRAGMKGLNPDDPLEAEEERIHGWLARHPRKKGISSERREELRKRMRKLRGMKE